MFNIEKKDIESLTNCIKPNRAISSNSVQVISFNKGIFPDFLKVGNVISVHKKGEKLVSNNYRPISLLSNIS